MRFYNGALNRGVCSILSIHPQVKWSSSLFVACTLVSLGGCVAMPASKPSHVYEPSKQARVGPIHNSRTALDWPGVYQGVLPCGDCSGIKTWLLLKHDMSYVLKTQYLGKSDETFKELGNFAWDESGSSIVLGADPRTGARFKVMERQLMQTDSVGDLINPKSPEDYILKQVARLRAPNP